MAKKSAKTAHEQRTVKSITTKALNDGKEVTKKQVGSILGSVMGIARKAIIHNGQYGEQWGFGGDFIGKTVSGAIITSEAIFLPKAATDQILAELKDSDEKEVQINCEVKITESTKNAKGIAFVVDLPETETRKTQRAALHEAFASQNGLELTG